MDGFEGNTGIIVIAATNHVDILDSALLRPGRFDRRVTVDVPNIRGRTEILKVHVDNKKFDADVSLDVTAMRNPGFSGADLPNLLNESAILAGHRGKTAISLKEIDDTIDRIVAGMEGTMMTDRKSKSLVAYHEVRHAFVASYDFYQLVEDIDAVMKRISDSVYEIAPFHIRNNREAEDKIAELLEKETMTRDEFHAILSEFGEIPAVNRVPPSVPSPVSV